MDSLHSAQHALKDFFFSPRDGKFDRYNPTLKDNAKTDVTYLFHQRVMVLWHRCSKHFRAVIWWRCFVLAASKLPFAGDPVPLSGQDGWTHTPVLRHL